MVSVMKNIFKKYLNSNNSVTKIQINNPDTEIILIEKILEIDNLNKS